LIRLTAEREARDLSKAALGRLADLKETRIRQAELHGLRLGDGEIARLAAALNDYTGDPQDLLREIGD
jgi:hypothetical protein